MRKVELIYDLDCPNVEEARKVLLQAFGEARVAASWVEWDRKASESPSYARRYGSPTILVDGEDVAGSEQGECADSCRVYGPGASGSKRVPPVSSIVAALQSRPDSDTGNPVKGTTAWRRSLASLPGLGAALLPVGGCPACWPVYSGVLGSLGLTFLLNSDYLLWVDAVLMGLALVALAYRAKGRRGYKLLMLGALSAALILFFKFAVVYAPMSYAGLFGLAIASLWNAWPTKGARAGLRCEYAATNPLPH